jgi:hypothetical protein
MVPMNARRLVADRVDQGRQQHERRAIRPAGQPLIVVTAGLVALRDHHLGATVDDTPTAVPSAYAVRKLLIG